MAGALAPVQHLGWSAVDRRCYIFFDVDDTLVEWTVSWGEAFALAAREFGVEVDPDRARQVIETAFTTYYDDCLATYAATDDEYAFWGAYDGRILADLGVPATRLPQATGRVVELLKRPEAIRLYDEVPAVLQALSERGLRLGIVTGRPKAAPDLEALEVRRYFDPLIDAFSAGSSKSAGRMFQIAAQVAAAAGLPAWHVGDSYEDDVLGAQAAGLRPVLVDRGDKHPGADCPRIRDLRELADTIVNGR